MNAARISGFLNTNSSASNVAAAESQMAGRGPHSTMVESIAVEDRLQVPSPDTVCCHIMSDSTQISSHAT